MNTQVRVRVWAGNKKQDLGLGTLEGYVNVFLIQLPGGTLTLLPDAEARPTAAEVAALYSRGGILVEWPGNPKIRLDSGQVVYGCLVRWSPLYDKLLL
jgi:hypothetical protein